MSKEIGKHNYSTEQILYPILEKKARNLEFLGLHIPNTPSHFKIGWV